MLLVFFACIRWPVGPVARIKQVAEELIRPLFAGATVLELAVLSFAAGFGEEMLFRGVLQPLFGRWLGVAGGLAAASVLFGLFHPLTRGYIVLAAALGAYLGWLAVATQNLVCPIVAHGVYDWVALIVLLRTRPPIHVITETLAGELPPAPPVP